MLDYFYLNINFTFYFLSRLIFCTKLSMSLHSHTTEFCIIWETILSIYLFIYLQREGREREQQTYRDHHYIKSLFQWLQQSGLGAAKPKTLSWVSPMCAGTQALEPFSVACKNTWAGSWMKSGAAWTLTSGCSYCISTHSITMSVLIGSYL